MMPARRTVRHCFTALVALLIMACSDRIQSTAPARGSTIPGASRTISDGAHGGNANVFFLPPMVANPTKATGYGNPFQAGLNVSINVRDLFTNGYVATFGPSAVGVNTTDGYYFVNWDTKATALDVTHTYRIEVLVGGKVPAYADVVLGNNGSALKNVDTQDYVALVDGRTLPIKVRIQQGLTFDCTSTNSGACTTSVVPPTLPPGQTAVVQTGDQQNAVQFSGGWSNANSPVVVTLEDVTNQPNPVNCQTLVNVALAPVAQNHCLHITTDPQVTLQTPAIVVTCWAQHEDHRELLLKYDAGETPQFLQDGPIPVGVQCPTQIGSARPSSNPLVRFASAVLSGIGRVFGVKAAYAFDSGVGSIVDVGSGFSYFSPAAPVQLSIVSGNAQAAATGNPVADPLVVNVSYVHDVGPNGASPIDATASVVCFPGTAIATSATNNQDGTYTCPSPVVAMGANSFTVAIAGEPNQINLDTGDGVVQLNESVTFTETGTNTIFSDGFEAATNWSADPFWNRSMLAGIGNSAFSNYVTLAPNDGSHGALPAPFGGQFAFWYGQPTTGNYIGTQSPQDYQLSGGMSTTANAGSLASPPFTIPAGVSSVTLSFETWWEIEAVNPSHYDLMRVGVIDVSNPGAGPVFIGQLNPTSDPASPLNRSAIPYTSGGYNLPPTWQTVTQSLAAYAGKTIQLVLRFDTVDQEYNGYRGWIVDNVAVVVGGSPAAAAFTRGVTSASRTIFSVGSGVQHASLDAAPTSLNPITPPGTRTP